MTAISVACALITCSASERIFGSEPKPKITFAMSMAP